MGTGSLEVAEFAIELLYGCFSFFQIPGVIDE
jgi:hypothetical protein